MQALLDERRNGWLLTAWMQFLEVIPSPLLSSTTVLHQRVLTCTKPSLRPRACTLLPATRIHSMNTVGLNTVKLGDFSGVEDCKDACTSNKACTMFTWNEHVAPHNCFGYTGSAPAIWDAKVNSHCISGCNIKKVAHCGDSPRPVLYIEYIKPERISRIGSHPHSAIYADVRAYATI